MRARLTQRRVSRMPANLPRAARKPEPHPRLRQVMPIIRQCKGELKIDPLDERLLQFITPKFILEAQKPILPDEGLTVAAIDVDRTLLTTSIGDMGHAWLQALDVLQPPPMAPENREDADYLWSCTHRTVQMARLPVPRLRAYVKALFDHVILSDQYQEPVPFIDPHVRLFFDQHRGHRHYTVLASASPFVYIDVLREFLEADFAIGTRSHLNHRNETTHRIHWPLSVHVGKATLLLSLLDHLGASLEQLYVYSDDPHTDLPVMLLPTVRGHTVAVNPNFTLIGRCKQLGFHLMQHTFETAGRSLLDIERMRLAWVRAEAAKYRASAAFSTDSQLT